MNFHPMFYIAQRKKILMIALLLGFGISLPVHGDEDKPHDCKSTLQTLQWICKSECLVVNMHTKKLVPLGAVLGTSHLNLLEAFEDMLQNCENSKIDSGLSGQAIGVKGFQYSHEETSDFSESESSEKSRLSAHSLRRGLLWGKATQFIRFETNKWNTFQRFFIDEKFSISVDSANPVDACIEVKTNPYGKPKYIGSEKPLG